MTRKGSQSFEISQRPAATLRTGASAFSDFRIAWRRSFNSWRHRRSDLFEELACRLEFRFPLQRD